MDCGEKIVALRKSKGMTQAELGAELNVTFQAVSKWERGESCPDFLTLCRIAKLFGVTINYFEDDKETPATETSEEIAPTVAPAESKREMLGFCKKCGKVVYEGEEHSLTPVVCKACNEQEKAAKEREQTLAAQREEAARRMPVMKGKRARRNGLITAGAICAPLLCVAIGESILRPETAGEMFGGAAILILFLFPFITQLFWGGTVREIATTGGLLVGKIGVIFTLDIDGLIFLILAKVFLFIVSAIIFVFTSLFVVFVAIVISPFTFVPQIIKVGKGKFHEGE